MNARRFGAVGTIGSIYMVFGCMFIGGFNGFYGFKIIGQYPDAYAVSTPIAPAIACGVIGIIIAYLFMSISSFSSDAILQNFLLVELLLFSLNKVNSLQKIG